MKVNSQKLFEEILDIIDDFYGLPEGPEIEDLNFRIQMAITSSEQIEAKPKLKEISKKTAKKPRKKSNFSPTMPSRKKVRR